MIHLHRHSNAGRSAFAVFACILCFSSCTWNYLDINTNPFEVSKEQMQYNGYATRASLLAIFGTVISPDVNTAQFTDVLLGGPMAHYYASTGSWDKTISMYNPTDEWTNPFLASDKIIPVLYSNLRTLEELTDDPVTHAIATIVKVQAMNRITDTYGPIPYSQIAQKGAISVPYDSQEQVYDKMFEELDQSIKILTENRMSAISPSADQIYGGDPVKWCKYANSLKLRLAMRIVYAKPDKSKQYAEEAVNHEIGVFTSNEDIARVPASIFGEGNSMYVAIKYNQLAGVNTGGDTHAAADIICYMNGYKDPRADKYFIPSLFKDKYVGMRVTIDKPNFTVCSNFSGVNLTRESDMVWMNATEVAFLRAEAAAVFGFDVLGSRTAKDFYEEGIALSFGQWGVTGAAEYAMNNENVPQTYTDPTGGPDSYPNTLTTLKVQWDEAADKETKQERIMIQKWIANYNLGNEAWADYRRTGYPRLIPATDSGNKSGKIVDNVLGPRRMPYPLIEYTNNSANINAAIAGYLKGPDNMATDLWWDCKPNHPDKTK